MRTTSVERAIEAALKNDRNCANQGHVDADEAKSIVKAAEYSGRSRSPVTSAEAGQIGDLFERRIKALSAPPPGTMMTMACPESSGSTMDSGAISTFETFFKKHDLPYGENVRGQIQSSIDANGMGRKLARQPAGVENMAYIFMHDNRMVDGDRLEAYVDRAKKQFYLKATGSGMGGPQTVGPFWSGPNKLGAAAPSVKPETIEKLRSAFKNAGSNLEWKSPAAALPPGERMESVLLQAVTHPDGYSYTALIPVGSLSPGSPKLDPNKAKEFYLERTGGFAGITQVAGPISLTSPKPMELSGVRNRMPIVGSSPDYVILPTQGWSSAPQSLTLDGKTVRVQDNGGGALVARGLYFSRDGSFDGQVQLQSGEKVPVKINVSTVF